jgi:peptidoglycan-associated lipoprotein
MDRGMTPMKPRTRTAARAVTIIAALAALAACAKPPAPVATPDTPPAQVAPPPPQQVGPQPPAPTASQAPIPGSPQDFIVNVGERVYFDLDEYVLRADALPVLDAQAAWLARYPAVNVQLEGNADERGTVEYNFALGARRANAVRDHLVSRGVAAGRIQTVSYGKERLIDTGTTEEAHQANRNVRTGITSGAR